VDALQAGLKLNPQAKAIPPALFDLGNSYLMLGKTKEAIASYQKSYDQDKKFWYPLNNIGLIRYEAGETEEAIKLWRSSLSVDAKASEPKLALAVALHKQGSEEEGLKLGEAAIRLDNRYADVKFLKENLWGDKLIEDTQKFLEQPRIKLALTQAKTEENQAPSPR
jgi:tetratricopeptide (TPR) repeat protein